MPHNTPPALAAAALFQVQRDPEAVMIVLPSNHVIAQPTRQHQACRDAYDVASASYIVTFAITLLGPETCNGDIKTGEALGIGVFKVAAFREKPYFTTAQSYIEAGNYAWNAGIFFFKARSLIAELEKFEPELLASVRNSLSNTISTNRIVALQAESFGKTPSISVDYAVLERTRQAAVAPVKMGWSDIGSFASLWEIGENDAANNSLTGEVALFDATNC